MNHKTDTMILLLMERLIDWRHRMTMDDTVTFFDVHTDISAILDTANSVLTVDSLNKIFRDLENHKENYV